MVLRRAKHEGGGRGGDCHGLGGLCSPVPLHPGNSPSWLPGTPARVLSCCWEPRMLGTWMVLTHLSKCTSITSTSFSLQNNIGKYVRCFIYFPSGLPVRKASSFSLLWLFETIHQIILPKSPVLVFTLPWLNIFLLVPTAHSINPNRCSNPTQSMLWIAQAQSVPKICVFPHSSTSGGEGGAMSDTCLLSQCPIYTVYCYGPSIKAMKLPPY